MRGQSRKAARAGKQRFLRAHACDQSERLPAGKLYCFLQAFFEALLGAGVDKEWLLLATAVSGDDDQLLAAQMLIDKGKATGTVTLAGRKASVVGAQASDPAMSGFFKVILVLSSPLGSMS